MNIKIHTTNYYNTFIEVAEDCPVSSGIVPLDKVGILSIAKLQYDMLINHPYRFSSDDILFSVFAIRKELPNIAREEQRQLFFPKASPVSVPRRFP